MKKSNGYWTEEHILEEAHKYTSLSEFTKKAKGAYDAANKKGLLEKIRTFLPYHFEKNGYWTYEKCEEESKKYTTRIDFHNNSSGAYRASVKNGWIESFVWIKSTRNEKYGKEYTIEELNAVSKLCYNKAEFKEKYYHQYRYSCKINVIDDLEFSGPIHNYKANNRRHIINSKYNTKGIPKCRSKYTYEKTYAIAQKYNTIGDFAKNEASAYSTAIYRGWLKDYSWLTKAHQYFSKEKCYLIAKECRSKIEFYKKNVGAYTYALKNNLMQEYTWFEPRKFSLEMEIEDFLIENNISYEKQKSFDWLRYKHRQFLDFYLPDFNIAIECQGIQHFKEISYFKSENRTDIKILDNNKKDLCEKHNIKILYYSNLNIKYPYMVFENKEELIRAINLVS